MTKLELKPFRITKLHFYISLFAVVLSLAVYVYFNFSIQKTGQSVAVLQQETASLEAQESAIGQLRTNLLSTEADRGKIASYFVESSNIVPFLETIEGYGKSVGVTVKFTNVTLSKAPNRLDVSIDAQGSFTNIYRFTALVEASPYEVVFGTTDIQSVASDIVPTKGAPSASAVWKEDIALSVLSINGVQ